MNRKFYEINRWMKQLYYANQQWFRVRDRFERLPVAEQERLFALMLQLHGPLYELQRVMADMQREPARQTGVGAASGRQ